MEKTQVAKSPFKASLFLTGTHANEFSQHQTYKIIALKRSVMQCRVYPQAERLGTFCGFFMKFNAHFVSDFWLFSFSDLIHKPRQHYIEGEFAKTVLFSVRVGI